MNDGYFRIVRSESHTIARNELVIDSFWISIYSRAGREGINRIRMGNIDFHTTPVAVTIIASGEDAHREWFSWGQYLLYANSNEYGTSVGTPIFTNDYITDPAIIARIRKSCEEKDLPYSSPPLSGVESIEEEMEAESLSMNNNEIIYSGDSNNVTSITIFDTTGHQSGVSPFRTLHKGR